MSRDDQLIAQCAAAIAKHAVGMVGETIVPTLGLYNVPSRLPRASTLYTPRLCAVFQGEKRVEVGTDLFLLKPGSGLLATVDMPVTSSVIRGSRAEPHLALTLELDALELAEVMLGVSEDEPAATGLALGVTRLDTALLDSLTRLLGLLDTPFDIPVMFPLLRREIHYRLVRGPHGEQLRRYAMAGSQQWRIARTTSWLTNHFAESMRVDELADTAGMSVTAFHRHFKAITGLTPLQYRTQLRLQEARRRLLAEGRDVGAIAFSVGYESQSQFGREYRRLFGRSPGADAMAMRGELSRADGR
ncbi:MAG: AraC family transcriptional regulator [Luteibacter sp.]